MVLIELGLSEGASDPQAALEQLFEAGLEAGLVRDGMVAQSAPSATRFGNCASKYPKPTVWWARFRATT